MTEEEKHNENSLLSPEHNQLSEEDIRFLHWFDETFLKQQTPFLQKTTKYIAPFLAGPANLIAFFLGKDFGIMIGNLFHADEDTTKFLSIFCAIVAYTPSVILYYVAASRGLSLLAEKFSSHADLFKQEERKNVMLPMSIIKYTLAPFAGIPFMAYMKRYLNNDAGNAMVGILIMASFAAALSAETMIMQSILTSTENKHIKKNRTALNSRFDLASYSIKSIEDESLTALYDTVLTQSNFPLNENNVLKKFHRLLLPTIFAPKTITPPKEVPAWHDWAINIFSYVMAAIAMYPLYARTNEATEWFCNWSNIPDHATENIKLLVAFLSITANALFCGFYASTTFSQLKKKISKQEYCPDLPTITATGFSMAASTMNTVIALQSGASPWFAAPAFTIPTAMRIMAFVYLIGVCQKLYTRYRFPDSPKTQREILLDLLTTLKMKLSLMDSDYSLSLDNALKILDDSRSPPHSTFSLSRTPSHLELLVRVESPKSLTAAPGKTP